MIYKLIISSLITLITLDIGNLLTYKAEHKNNLINKFCVATLKSKLKSEDKEKIDEISHYTCQCFLKKYKSTNSFKKARTYCKNKSAKKFNL
tara:strand:- start:228 stop:503 length:276 start_codon:yes stop_codon:yes gene_type:complete